MDNEQSSEHFGKLIFSGKKDEVQKEIDLGADLNQINSTGMTPLIIAVEGDHPEILELLLKNGANPNKQGELNGLAPLHWAVDYAFDGMVQNNRITPYPEPLECIRILIKYGADTNIKDNSGETVFDFPLTKEILNALRPLE